MVVFVESLLRPVVSDWAVPDYSTLWRRQGTLDIASPFGAAVAR
ncbi:transposase [Tropicimonas sp.]